MMNKTPYLYYVSTFLNLLRPNTVINVNLLIKNKEYKNFFDDLFLG